MAAIGPLLPFVGRSNVAAQLAELYGMEKQARGQSPEARMALRQDNSKPIFNDLEDWLHAQLPKISGKSPLAQTIRYALNRMPKTRPYLDNGFLELDNNTAERAMKSSPSGVKTGCFLVHNAVVILWLSPSP